MFVHVITRHDKLPYWECLGSDFTQEELRLSIVNGTTNNNGKRLKVEMEEENFALVGMLREKKGPSQGQ